MPAEPIASVIADIRAGRVRNALPDDQRVIALSLPLAQTGTVVDATAIYDSLVAVPRQVSFYEDHPCITPPWESASICYVNGHGNVIVMAATATELKEPTEQWKVAVPGEYEIGLSGHNHEVEWERVRWRLDTFLWLGGRSDQRGGEFPTTGPVHLWQFAIYEDGEPADIHWVHLVPEYPMEHWDMALATLLGSLNFMNCRNVTIVEPHRPRAERRRLDRLGVSVHTINVLPVGKSSRSAKGDRVLGVPLTSVRGHFSCYGPEYNRGLLFGKLAGRYWIPQHARGNAEMGESEHDYRLLVD